MIVASPPAAVAPAPIAPRRLAGIQATGPRAELDRLQAMARASGIPANQLQGPEGREVLIAFPATVSDEAVAAFLTKLRESGFARLHFRSVVLPAR